MTLEEWIVKNNCDKETQDLIYDLKKEKPYSDKMIIEAVDKIYITGKKCGLTLKEVVALVCINESNLYVLR